MIKRILITGKSSYIGTHLYGWIKQYYPEWNAEMADIRDDKWKNIDLGNVDAIVHIAGLVHHPEVTDYSAYKSINTDLTASLAKRAKDNGVRQFVFLSTMAVYGVGKKLCPNIIDEYTIPNPSSAYGESKYCAEKELLLLSDDSFTVSIVRPPNVYGANCKGRYITGFKSLVKKSPIIPNAYNNCKQSMLYIDNLSNLICLLISKCIDGTFMPQDDQSVSAVDLMKCIANALNKKLIFSNLLGRVMYFFSYFPIVNKVYGGVEYSKELSAIPEIDYQVVSLNEGIERTITGK